MTTPVEQYIDPTESQLQKKLKTIKKKQEGKDLASLIEYEKQMHKIRSAEQARNYLQNEAPQVHTLYVDDHIIVANKPSGLLCVPGINNNRSLANQCFDLYPHEEGRVDRMIVHRLDMHTSGLVVFARTTEALKELHMLFRDRLVKKQYEALIVGHLDSLEGEINLPLARDPKFPPFMRVSTPESEIEAQKLVAQMQHVGYKKKLKKAPKESMTTYSVVNREQYNNLPVTRVALTPVTGRTHQLRVHCAAIGHPILADGAYGFGGEAASNGGLSQYALFASSPSQEEQASLWRFSKDENKQLCLHAKLIWFPHPISKAPLKFECPPPF